jgi:hypothetical protein
MKLIEIYNRIHKLLKVDTCKQGSFFRLQNTEGLTLVGLFMEGTTLTCLETYSDSKKRTLPASGNDVALQIPDPKRPLHLHSSDGVHRMGTPNLRPRRLRKPQVLHLPFLHQLLHRPNLRTQTNCLQSTQALSMPCHSRNYLP